MLTTHVRHSAYPTGPKANRTRNSANFSSINRNLNDSFKSVSPTNHRDLSHADVYVEFAYGDEDDEGSVEDEDQS